MKSHKGDLFVPLMLGFIGISGAFSVLFGAWLAHAGQALPDDDLARLIHAHKYQFFHTVTMLVVTLWYVNRPMLWLKTAGIGFMLGILLFSGSLYLKTLFELAVLSKLAPVGGITLALAWLSISISSVSILKKEQSGEQKL